MIDGVQVIPLKRHSDSRVNALKADFSGEGILPVQFDNELPGPTRKVPCLYSDLLWVSPYDVLGNYTPEEDCPTNQ